MILGTANLVTAEAAASRPKAPLAPALLLPNKTTPVSNIEGCGSQYLQADTSDCFITDDIRAGDVHEYTFEVPADLEDKYSVLLSAESKSGIIDMLMVDPKGEVYNHSVIFELAGKSLGKIAQAESFIRVSSHSLEPGIWKIRISGGASDRENTTFSVKVQTPSASTRLVPEEKEAVAAIYKDCCNSTRASELDGRNVELCAKQLPMAIQPVTDAATDLCQVGPFACNAKGRLEALMVGGAGLSCSSFPTAIGAFTDLRQIEFDVARCNGCSFKDVAKVLEPLKNLEHISFQDTDVTGPLPCGLVDGKKIHHIDVTDSGASGQLPGCILALPTLQSLLVTRTRLAGPIPDTVPKGSALRVLYGWNQDRKTGRPWTQGGFSGPLPKSLANAKQLTDLVLPFHQLSGVSDLPGSLSWLDLKFNRIQRLPGKLPPGLRILDVSNNLAAGPLPDLKDNMLLWVNLTGNQITGPLHSDLGASEGSLAVLSLSQNRISGPLSAINWSKLTALQFLDLKWNLINGSIPASLAYAPSLRYVDLSWNHLGGTLDAFAGALPKAGNQITSFDISNNFVGGAIPASLSRLGVFNKVPGEPPKPVHFFVLSNNKIWTDIPAFMLEAVGTPAGRNPCGCIVSIDLVNNTRFCPLKATVAALPPEALAGLTAPGAVSVSCLMPDMTRTPLKAYLAKPSAFITGIPPAPAAAGKPLEPPAAATAAPAAASSLVPIILTPISAAPAPGAAAAEQRPVEAREAAAAGPEAAAPAAPPGGGLGDLLSSLFRGHL